MPVRRKTSLTRRESVLLGLGTVAALVGNSGCSTPQLEEALFAADALFEDVLHYDGMGVHLTGTPEDLATSDWLEALLVSNGFATRRHPFSVQAFEARQSVAIVGNVSTPLVVQEPHSFGPLSLSAPIVAMEGGQTRLAGLRGSIALVELPPLGDATISANAAWPILVEAARLNASAAVAVTNGPTGEIIFHNTPKDADRLPLPILLLAPSAAGPIRQAAAAAADIRIRVEGERRTRQAFNLIGERGDSGPLVVVSTPQSGWTNAASERGVGIAFWRAIARWAVRRPQYRWRFISTSGHEFAHAGLDALIQQGLMPRTDALKLWIHLGANIASYDYDRTADTFSVLRTASSERVLVASPEILADAQRAFGGLTGLTPRVAQVETSRGEVRRILAEGFEPVFSIFGRSAWHHCPSDRAGVSTGPDILAPVGAAMERFLNDALI